MNNIKKYLPDIFLSILLLVISYNHIQFALIDSRPVIDHDSEYTTHCTLYYYKLLANKNNRLNDYDYLLQQNTHTYIRLLDKYVGIIFYLLKKNFFYFRMSFLPLFLLFIFSSYLLGSTLNNKWAGLLICLTLCSIPGVISHSRSAWPHMYTASFVLFAIIYLFKCQNFLITKYAILFGIYCGICFHIHHSALLYIAIIYIWITFNLTKSNKKVILITIALAIVFYVIICFHNSLRMIQLITFLALIFLFNQKSKPIQNFIISILTLILIIPPYFHHMLISQLKAHSQTLLYPNNLSSLITYLKHIIEEFDFKSGFLNTFYFYFFFYLTLIAIIYLIKNLKKNKTIENKFSFLFLLLIFQSILPLLTNTSAHVNILTLTLITFLIINFILKIKNNLLLKSTLISIIIFFMFLNNFLAKYFYHLPYLKNNFCEAIIPDKNDWGREKIKNFIQTHNQTNALSIGLFCRPFPNYPYYLYPFDGHTLELLNTKAPLKITKIIDSAKLQEILQKKMITFLFLEDTTITPLDNTNIEEIIKNNGYKLHSNLKTSMKKINIYTSYQE